MDPFTIALATFGVQKLRGKSTKRALRDAAILGGGSYAFQGAAQARMIPGVEAGSGIGKIGYGDRFSGISGLIGTPDVSRDKAIKALKEQGSELSEDNIKKYIAQSGSGFKGMSTTGKVLAASSILPFLDQGEDTKAPFSEEDYKKAYKDQSSKLEGAFVPATNTVPSMSDVYGSNMFYANRGGLATAIPKYNQGGINYLPSKIDHNENDVNNYVRAEGYVEDGAGAGDKDEDTMLAQLADGEFVSRADAVLGAGILSGADPKSFKNMRKAGADFFYDQQKKFKRIYDIVNASKQN